MNIKDAIDAILITDNQWLDEHNSCLSIDLGEGGLRFDIPWRLLIRWDWSISHVSNDPEFANAVKGLVKTLKEEGPIVCDGDEVHKLN